MSATAVTDRPAHNMPSGGGVPARRAVIRWAIRLLRREWRQQLLILALDEGESIGALLSRGPVTPALAHLSIDKQGFAWLSEDDFVNHFAADVDPVKAKVMYAVQQPLAASAFEDVMGVPAWKSLPSWYLVANDDQAIPPDAERLFATRMGATTVEVPSSHVAMVSHPDDVVQLIATAAEALPAAN